MENCKNVWNYKDKKSMYNACSTKNPFFSLKKFLWMEYLMYLILIDLHLSLKNINNVFFLCCKYLFYYI